MFIHKISPKRAGGVDFYVKKELLYTCQDNNMNLSLNCVEDMWNKIEAKPHPIFIGVIYRHPSVNTVEKIEQFGGALFGIMHDLNLKTATNFVLGDFNLDLMNVSSQNNAIKKYSSNLLGCSCKCLIKVPTRITQTSKTLINRIFVSMFPKSTVATHSGETISDISDHHGTFVNVSLKSAHKKKASSFSFVCDMKNFQLEKFTDDLGQNLGNFLVENSDQIDFLFNKFFSIFAAVVDKHALLKRASKKEKRLQQKLWLSTLLLKSVKRKNKMYANLQLKYTKNNFKGYKAYRNALNRALQSAKQNYYQTLLSSNQHSRDRLWKVLNELVGLNKSKRVLPNKLIVDGNEINDSQTIAETFNNSFVNIGKTMGFSIAPVRHEIVKIKWCKNSFFLESSTSAKVEAIINELSNKKSKHQNDIETKFIKYSKTVISTPLSDLFHLCVSKGVFPQYL